MVQACISPVEVSKAPAHRPALMENCYQASRGPLMPGEQPQLLGSGHGKYLASQDLRSAGACHSRTGLEQHVRRPQRHHGAYAQNQSSVRHNGHFALTSGDYRRSGQRNTRITAAPAAALKLLDGPVCSAPIALCKAPVSCRLASSNFPVGVLDRISPLETLGQIENQQEYSFMIQTPTGSSAFDTMPSTPLEEDLASNGQNVLWPPRSAAEAARHAPSGHYVANVYCSNQNDVLSPPMPMMQLSEIIPGQQSVYLMEPSLRPLQEYNRHPQSQVPASTYMAMQDISSTGPSRSIESTSASEGSGQIEGSLDHQALPKAELGSPELPSRGSALHAWQACKPCAFMFQEGCANKEECEFCHLCEPGERKRRKKERKYQRRDVREQAAPGGLRTLHFAQVGMR